MPILSVVELYLCCPRLYVDSSSIRHVESDMACATSCPPFMYIACILISHVDVVPATDSEGTQRAWLVVAEVEAYRDGAYWATGSARVGETCDSIRDNNSCRLGAGSEGRWAVSVTDVCVACRQDTSAVVSRGGTRVIWRWQSRLCRASITKCGESLRRHVRLGCASPV